MGMATAFEVGGMVLALLGYLVMTYASNNYVQIAGGAMLGLGLLVACIAGVIGFAIRLWNGDADGD